MKSVRLILRIFPVILGSAVVHSLAADARVIPPAPLQVAFAAEPVDAEWSGGKTKYFADALSAASSYQIDCRSSSCRVEVTWNTPVDGESWQQFTQRVSQWTVDVAKGGGFRQGDTDFTPGIFRTVSWFSTRSVGPQR